MKALGATRCRSPPATSKGSTAWRPTYPSLRFTRAEICFSADRILLIAQIIADKCQQFDERDSEIGGVAFRPLRTQHRDAVEH